MERETISNNNRDFIRQAIKEDVRIDGRGPYEHRKLDFQISLDDHSATVQLGGTRVMAAVAAALESPFGDRSREGVLRFNVELSPMASPAFEAGRMGEDAIELARVVERAIKQSGAIDMEALCVLPGRKVWSLRVDLHVLDHCGNLADAACLAALTALMAYRKPQTSVANGEEGEEGKVVVHSPEVREPQPLSIHHLPFSITFALFEGGNLVAVDPSLQEEAAAEGSITLVVNPHGEVCAAQKADGVGVSRDQLMRCVRLAEARAGELAAGLKEALKSHEVARVAARVRRRGAGPAAAGAAAAMAVGGAGGVGGGDGRHVVVLRDVGAADDRLAAMLQEMEATAKALAEVPSTSGSSSDDSSSDDDSSSTDTSSSDDEGGTPPAKQQQGKQQQQQQQQQRAPGAAGVKPGGAFIKPSKPTLKSEDFTKQATIGKRPLPQPAAMRGRPNRPRVGDPAAAAPDNLAAIAAIIAGAGGGGSSDGAAAPSLASAIKPGAKKKMGKGKGQQQPTWRP